MRIDVSIVPVHHQNEWIAALRELRSDVFSRPSWGIAAAEVSGGSAVLAVAHVDTQCLAALPLLVRSIDSGGFDVTSPYGYPGLCPRPNICSNMLAQSLQAICAELAKRGFVSCFIRCNPLVASMPDLGVGHVVHHGATVSVSLAKSLPTRLSELASGHRYEIRRTALAGVTVRLVDSVECWKAFQFLYEDAMRRLKAPSWYQWSQAHWKQLRVMADAGDASLLMSFNGSEPLGGALFLHSPGTGIVHYHLAAASRSHPKLQPGKLLLWEAQQHFREAGYEVLHLGGGFGGKADSLFQFKAGFAPERHPFFTRRVILDESVYRSLSGAAQTDFFPAYRAPRA